MSDPKISIIVPIYNCADYLGECIDSLLTERDLYDIEVLLIDDGSTDGSDKVCDEYASLYPQVRVIHTENRGVSCARNMGIEEATGDWIMFVDADDILEANTLSILDKEANFQQYEITRFGMYRFGGRKGLSMNCKFSENVDEHRNLVLQRDAIVCACGGIYARNLFMKNSIRFSPEIKVGEDWIVSFKLLCHTRKFYYLNKPLYGYRVNPESVTEKKIDYVRTSNMIAFNSILDYAKEHAIPLNEISVCKAKSELRRGAMKKAIFHNSKAFYSDTERAIKQYLPQSLWKDIRYSKKPKHLIVFITYKILLLLYKLYDRGANIS